MLVCMERTSDPSLVIDPAQTLTTEMFDQIGVALVWRDLKHCPGEARPIVIRLSVNTPRGVLPGALAVSYPFEGVHIQVFYDRVRTDTASCPLPVLLAHVLAHEIGHMLRGTDGHSAGGVMKRNWDTSDFARMARQPLPFTDLDIRAIRRGWRGLTGMVYGRRMYEVMRYWDDDLPDWDAEDREYAAVWRSRPKWVVSRSLKSVGANATLVENDIEAMIRGLKAELVGEIEVAGPDLARSLTDLGLIDEYRLYIHPVVLGRGKPFFAGPRPPLRLVASDLVGEDVIRLTYVPT